ncbi:MAG: hypothetical protein E7254_12840 [Lachnospiraceae bacterium]|nr:hypothetical protein [Lachnospiraceae bacterium]
MRKLALLLAAAITLTSVGGNTVNPISHVYANEQKDIKIQFETTLFGVELLDNEVHYDFKDGVLTVSGKGVADESYLNICKVGDIKEIIIKPGITAIADGAFANLLNMKKITIPDTVTELGCSSLLGITVDNLVIPSSVKRIGVYCMYEGKVKSITMPGNFECVKEYNPHSNDYDNSYEDDETEYDGFAGVTLEEAGYYDILPKAEVMNLNTEYDPNNMLFFHGADKVNTFKDDKYYKTMNGCIYSKDGKKLVFVPSTTRKLKIRKGCEVVSVRAFAYNTFEEDYDIMYCRSLESIIIPSTVKELVLDTRLAYDDDTLEKCNWILKSKKVPGNVLGMIGYLAGSQTKKKIFTKKYGVKTVNGIVSSYDKYILKYKGKSKKFTIPKKYKGIAPFAFKGTSVKSVVIPKNWKKIDDFAFAESKISAVKMPSKIKMIGRGAFYKDKNLKSIKLPKSVTTIYGQAFYKCYNLKKVQFNKKLKYIGNSAFCNTEVKEYKIPDVGTIW